MNMFVQLYLWWTTLFGLPGVTGFSQGQDGQSVQTGERQAMAAPDQSGKSKKDEKKDPRFGRTGHIYNGF
jgi:hypothetical protein